MAREPIAYCDNMNESTQPMVSLEAISKGRGMDSVLGAYMEFFDRAKAAAVKENLPENEIFPKSMMGAAYRIYLLGVEDGMKGTDL